MESYFNDAFTSPLSQILRDMSLPPDSPNDEALHEQTPEMPNPRSIVNAKNVQSESELSGKACKVCGDRAVGMNFGVTSCESCKAFFRRNARRKKELLCPFSNICEINMISRRCCQACRLSKCFEVGMRKEYDVEKASKKAKKHKLQPCSSKQSVSRDDDLENVFDDGDNEEVTVSKGAFLELVRKAKEADKAKKCCDCKCKCGYYPQGTQLTAVEATSTQASIRYTTKPSPIATEVLWVPPMESPRPPPLLDERAISVSSHGICGGPLLPTVPAITRHVPMSTHAPVSTAISHINPMSPPVLSPQQVAAAPHLQLPFPSPVNTYEMMAANLNSRSLQPFPPSVDMLMYASPSASFSPTFHALQPMRPTSAFSLPPTPMPFLNLPLHPLPPATPAPINFVSDRRLSSLPEADRDLLKELCDLSGILRAPIELDGALIQPNPELLTLMDIVKISELALRRIIQHAKEMHHFKKFKTEDQYALIKGSVAELLILRGVMVFNKHEEEWKHLIHHGTSEMKIKLAVLKQAFASSTHYEEHKKFMDNFDEQWRNNELVMLILNAITLFDPQRPQIQDKALVHQTHKLYCDLLNRYLHTQCSECEAQAAFKSLCARLDDIPKLAQGLWMIYGKLDPNSVDPLLRELFDIVQ